MTEHNPPAYPSLAEEAARVEAEQVGPSGVYNRNTDRANGQEFVARYRDRALWVPGMDWLICDGRRWVPDTGRARYRLIEELTDDLRSRGESYASRVTRLERSGGPDAALAFAASGLEVPLVRLDEDPMLINFPNGTYDARVRKLRPHRPQDYLTRLCPTELHLDARDAVWDKVLAEIFDGDDRYEEAKLRHLRRFAGYTLLGLTNEKKIMVPYGPRDTAKSTVTIALFAALGDVADGGYATTWDSEVIQAGTNVNRLEKLDKAHGARMIYVGELDKGARMADGFVKRFSGGDPVDACAKYKPSYTYRPQGKLWLPTNYVPRSADKAVQGRLDLLPFRHVPEKIDRSIIRHLESDDGARRAVLAWAMAGLDEYLDAVGSEHRLGETPWLDALIKTYAHESEALLDFLEACFTEVDIRDLAGDEDDNSPHVDLVWQAYDAWAQDNVPRPFKRRVFEYALREQGYEKARVPSHGGSMRWRGLTMHPYEDLPTVVQVRVRVLTQALTSRNTV